MQICRCFRGEGYLIPVVVRACFHSKISECMACVFPFRITTWFVFIRRGDCQGTQWTHQLSHQLYEDDCGGYVRRGTIIKMIMSCIKLPTENKTFHLTSMNTHDVLWSSEVILVCNSTHKLRHYTSICVGRREGEAWNSMYRLAEKTGASATIHTVLPLHV